MARKPKEPAQDTEARLADAVRASAQEIWQHGLAAFVKARQEGERAPGSWGKLEQVFEDRVARALAAIGVPARSEVEALARRVDELEQVVAGLAARGRSRAKKPPAKAATANKPAAKKATATKPAAQQAATRKRAGGKG